MDKIKVSKEVAIALDTALKVMDKEKFFEEHSNKFRWTLDIYLPLNQISNWEMAQILINGYKVEETPEEKILQMYKEWESIARTLNNHSYEEGYSMGYLNATEAVLNKLDKRIKGIND